MASDTLLTYPDFNEEFKIHTDARNFRLVGVIIQKCKLIAFYIRKLTDAHERCTVTKIDMSIIFETLKEVRTTLLGQRLIIYTGDKNLHVRILILIEC